MLVNGKRVHVVNPQKAKLVRSDYDRFRELYPTLVDGDTITLVSNRRFMATFWPSANSIKIWDPYAP